MSLNKQNKKQLFRIYGFLGYFKSCPEELASAIKISHMTQNLQFKTLKLAIFGAHIRCPSITPNVCDNHFSNLVQLTLIKL